MIRALLELAGAVAAFFAGYFAHAYDQRAVWGAMRRGRGRQIAAAELRGYQAGVHDRTPPPVPATREEETV